MSDLKRNPPALPARLACLFSAACLLASWQTGLTAAVAAERPNLLFIYLDDFGWRDAGFMGSDFFETPHLDRLASESMTFTDAYSCAANCAPARACLLSGQYTPRHQIFNVGTGPRGNGKHRRLLHVPGVSTLDPALSTWARQLKDAGYTTALMGKWHLSDDPQPYGFDINIGGSHSGSPPKGYYPPHPRAPGLESAPPDEYLTDRLSAEAVTFIRRERERPWALYLTHFAVHTPLNAKRELVDKYEAKPPGTLHRHVAMATMIQAVDDGVGQILAALDELQLADRTIVVFFSDNGGLASATDMAPLRGYKGTYYEGGIRVPLTIKWPGVTRPGARCEAPVIGVDLYPTFCEMTGARLPAKQTLDGRSLAPLLRGEAREWPSRSLYWHFPAYLQAGGKVEGAESRDPLFRSRPCSVVRRGPWKLHHYYEDDGLELYNLRDDIGETNNLAAAQPERTAELLRDLNGWRRDVKAPAPGEPNPGFDAEAEARAIRMGR